MLSKRLYLIFGSGAIFMFVLVVFFLPRESRWVSVFIIPWVVLLVMTYIFSPQVDWWWYQRNPPELPGSLGNLFLKYMPFYQDLSVANKKRFRQRVAMYLQARGFFAKRGSEDGEVPLDMKAIIAANVVMLTFGRKDFILKDFERIFIYLQAFPSPNHQYLHAAELNKEDDCVLLSGEHVMLSFRQPRRFYNVMVHIFANAYQLCFPTYDYPSFEEFMWEGWGQAATVKYLGIPEEEMNKFGVAANYFFHFPRQLKENNSRTFDIFCGIFNLNPLNKKDPVVDKTEVANVP
ncbi:MAG: zinc-dependent peptidase [Bacteroidota bacterium]